MICKSSGYSSWSYWSARVKRSCGRKRVWAQRCFLVCAALKVSMHHLFLQPSVAGAQPAPTLFRRSSLEPNWSIKTIFLMFVLFTPVLDHPWMSTLWRGGCLGKDNPVPKPDCMPVQIILHQGHSDVCIMPTSSRMTFKVTLGAQACTFNKISPMHYMDEFSLLATHLNCVHASRCVDVWYLWTEARKYKSKKMGLVSLTKQK